MYYNYLVTIHGLYDDCVNETHLFHTLEEAERFLDNYDNPSEQYYHLCKLELIDQGLI